MYICWKCLHVNRAGEMPKVKHKTEPQYFYGCSVCKGKTFMFGEFITTLPVSFDRAA